MYLIHVKKKNPGHRNTLHCTAPKMGLSAFAPVVAYCPQHHGLVGNTRPLSITVTDKLAAHFWMLPRFLFHMPNDEN